LRAANSEAGLLFNKPLRSTGRRNAFGLRHEGMSPETVSRPEADLVISVLIVLDERMSVLPNLLRHSHWQVRTAASFEDAALMLRSATPGVVIVPHRSTGLIRWPEFLPHLQMLHPPPRLIVTDPCADESMWAQALNLGAYDVLAQPFEREEVFRILSSAWQSWRHAQRRTARSGYAA
jgi:DNA-binding NtrC family response regulator